MRIHHSAVLAAAFAAFLASGGLASAALMHFTADLSAASEVPPTMSKGTGTADITYDTTTKMLTWSVKYSGLTGPAIAAHFHGPAAKGKNAGVALPLKVSASPIKGSAALSDKQAKQLEDGMWYLNIHTAANKGGEIRGQVTKVSAM